MKIRKVLTLDEQSNSLIKNKEYNMRAENVSE